MLSEYLEPFMAAAMLRDAFQINRDLITFSTHDVHHGPDDLWAVRAHKYGAAMPFTLAAVEKCVADVVNSCAYHFWFEVNSTAVDDVHMLLLELDTWAKANNVAPGTNQFAAILDFQQHEDQGNAIAAICIDSPIVAQLFKHKYC